jgi:hypothetical protein
MSFTFCTFKKIQETTTAEKRCQEQQSVCRRKQFIRRYSDWKIIGNLFIMYKQKLKLISHMLKNYWVFRTIQKWNNRKQTDSECFCIPNQLHKTGNREVTKSITGKFKKRGEEARILSHSTVTPGTMTQKDNLTTLQFHAWNEIYKQILETVN